jgi:chemotaxis protein MotB
LKTLRLSLLICLGLTGPAVAQEGAAPVANDETSKLIDTMQTRVEQGKASVRDTAAAMAILSDQVEAAIRLLSSRETDISALRGTALGLSDEVTALAATRDALRIQVTRLTEEKDAILARLQGQVRQLEGLLSLQREKTTRLSRRVDDGAAELRASLAARDRIAGDLSDLQGALAGQRKASAAQRRRMAALESRLADETAALETIRAALADARARNAALDSQHIAAGARTQALNRQLAALRRQLAALNLLLETSAGESQRQQQMIADLGRRLNLALATKLSELARYRSEFFGRLREVLGERADVRIVGDRFVFQSEVLFRTGEAELEEPGRTQLRTFVDSLLEIGRTIPADIDWVLRIDGHTDERPIQTSRFPSNWELSTARAISVVKFLIEHGVPARRVMAAGFAHFRPLDAGHDEIAFRRNRRIEFRLTQK